MVITMFWYATFCRNNIIVDWLKLILILKKNYLTRPNPWPNQGITSYQLYHIRSSEKFQDLPYHLPLWSMISKITLSFKSPVRNPKCPPSPKIRPDLNHIGSSSNFQDIIYHHDLWCQRWLHPPSIQSGILNVLQFSDEASQLNHAGSLWNFKHKLMCYKSIIKNCLFAIWGDYPMS